MTKWFESMPNLSEDQQVFLTQVPIIIIIIYTHLDSISRCSVLVPVSSDLVPVSSILVSVSSVLVPVSSVLVSVSSVLVSVSTATKLSDTQIRQLVTNQNYSQRAPIPADQGHPLSNEMNPGVGALPLSLQVRSRSSQRWPAAVLQVLGPSHPPLSRYPWQPVTQQHQKGKLTYSKLCLSLPE